MSDAEINSANRWTKALITWGTQMFPGTERLNSQERWHRVISTSKIQTQRLMRNNVSSQVVSLLILSCPKTHTLHSCCRQVFYFTTTHAAKLIVYCSYLKISLFWTENLGWSWKTIQAVFTSHVNFKHVWTTYNGIGSPRESTTPIKKYFS